MAIDEQVKKKRAGISAGAVVILLVVLAGGLGFWYLDQQSRNQTAVEPVLTAEAKQYVRNLSLSGVSMSAKESFMGHSLVEIVGTIGNNGDRTLHLVELRCVFFDPYGQVVLRQRAPIVRSDAAPLKPGEQTNFRLPFDSIPASWNQGTPQLVIAQILFE